MSRKLKHLTLKEIKERLKIEREIASSYRCLQLNYFEKEMPFAFDYERAKKDSVLITAAPQKGKTNTAKHIVEYILSKGDIVKVFDVSKAWHKSTMPTYQTIDGLDCRNSFMNPISISTIFDVSRLFPNLLPEFVSLIIGEDFQLISYLEEPLPYTIFYVLEECQLVTPKRLNSKRYQEEYRMVTVGGNADFKMRYIAISQRLADISTELISRTGQKYFGNHWEENDIKKLHSSLGKRWKLQETWEKFSELKVGQFMYCIDGNVENIIIPKFDKQFSPCYLEDKRSWLDKVLHAMF